jgi:hypothetical protein
MNVTTEFVISVLKYTLPMKTKFKKSNFRTGQRDVNEKEIIELLNRRNVKWTQFKPGDGADLLIWIAPMEVWEIKNPLQQPSKQELTEVEKEAKAYCENTGIPFIIIMTVEEANQRLNLFFEK